VFNRLRIALGILFGHSGFIGFRSYRPVQGLQLYDAAGKMDGLELELLSVALKTAADDSGGQDLLDWAEGITCGD